MGIHLLLLCVSSIDGVLGKLGFFFASNTYPPICGYINLNVGLFVVTLCEVRWDALRKG
jgi:hypothetical protein